MIPRATYRVQFHPDFTFADAAAIADYLAALGVSHLYASPYLQAAPGSTHGYDVVDPTRVNDELGGTEGHRNLCRTLRDLGLGQVLDIVPNHMAIGGPENAWWWDVLENGPDSPYALYFAVDWNQSQAWLGNKIFLPVLGDRYGRVLEGREIQLAHKDGRFTVRYHDSRFPMAPRSQGAVLEKAAESCGSSDLAFTADLLTHLTGLEISDREHKYRRYRNLTVIRKQLQRLFRENEEIRSAVDGEIEQINNDPDRLDHLLEMQNYLLAFWQAASQEMGYRRFFDINTLVGLRVEDETVFQDTHRLIRKWLTKGVLDGVRVDHPDGLRDPETYFKRLHALQTDAWVIAEKILHPGERLPETWPVAGTTGYDFLYLVGQLYIDPAGEPSLTGFYHEFTGCSADYAEVVREKRHQVMQDTLGGDIVHLTELFLDICRKHRHFRDYTRLEVSDALREVMAEFPVYRTYVMPWAGRIRPADRDTIAHAVSQAKERLGEDYAELLGFLKTVLLLEYGEDMEREFVLRFQQLTGPVMAKGVEDTAFYCFNRLIALNEVGGNPGTFGIPLTTFHREMTARAETIPHTMLTTSTHDTKRSEDVRARLALLSEIPRSWIEATRRWSGRNACHKIDDWPDKNMEYLLYQTLVGAWPIETDRLLSFAEKAGREAKVYTAWSGTNPAYEESLKGFITGIMEDTWFRSDFKKFVAPLVLPGRINALSQVLIKLTAPGVPDIYQGTEIWDMSLVDPDNRRPVDFEHRRRLLSELADLSSEKILEGMERGLPKLWVIRQALALRNRRPAAFETGMYRPIEANGEKASHVVAFSRNDEVVTIVPRWVLGLNGKWETTSIQFPPGSWKNVLTEEEAQGGRRSVGALLARFPVALLVRE